MTTMHYDSFLRNEREREEELRKRKKFKFGWKNRRLHRDSHVCFANVNLSRLHEDPSMNFLYYMKKHTYQGSSSWTKIETVLHQDQVLR